MKTEEQELFTLSSGDKVSRIGHSIVVKFSGKRRVLSTSVYGGGIRDDLTAVFNQDGTDGYTRDYYLLADTYLDHLKIVAERLGLDPDTVTGVSTAAQMKNVAISEKSYEGFTVTAIVTGGVDANGGRVGDPATFLGTPVEKVHHGTINTFLFLDMNMDEGTLSRALMTATEAKVAVLQELIVGSRYSNGIATGSGTDQTVIVANSTSPRFVDNVGKHSKIGELIGKAVMAATREALEKQTTLSPKRQHNLINRLKRFGITRDTVYEAYAKKAGAKVTHEEFDKKIKALCKEEEMLTLGSLLVHLIDQKLWGLISESEALSAGEKIAKLIAKAYDISAEDLPPLDEKFSLAVELLARAAQKFE